MQEEIATVPTTETSKKIHAFNNDLMADHDAVALMALIKAKQISVAELTQTAIQRAKTVEPTLKAIQHACFDEVLEQPQYHSKGIFAGIPFFIKDNTEVKGLPTQYGSAALHAKKSKKNSAVTRALSKQGFIHLGKSRLPEFGLNASTEFEQDQPTLNPWHTDYSAGASSGGSAALVAAGVVPIAHANDGGGSIRIPAACCGLIGLKPSRGRLIDGESARALPLNIIAEGVLTRSVRDTAQFFYGMEKVFYNKKLPQLGHIQNPNNKRLKIGIVTDSIIGQSDAETRQTVEQTAKLLESLGHHVEHFNLPIDIQFVKDFSIYWGMLSFMISNLGKATFGKSFDKQKLDPLTVGLADLYKKNFYQTPFTLYRLNQAKHLYTQIFQNYDAFISPVLAHTTPKIGYLSPAQSFDQLYEKLQNYVTFTPFHNVVGAPAISLPVGATAQDGLPIGIQISANIGQEQTLLELAFEIEQAQPWRRIQD